MPRRISVWPVAIQTLTPLGIGIIVVARAQEPAAAPQHPRHGQRTRQPPPNSISMIPALARCAGGEDVGWWRAARDRSRHRRDLDGNKSRRSISAQSPLARLSTSGEQQAMSHPVPACHAADRLVGLQGLFDKADLLVVTPSPPTLGPNHIVLHSRCDLKARLRSNAQAASQSTQGGLRRTPPDGHEEE